VSDASNSKRAPFNSDTFYRRLAVPVVSLSTGARGVRNVCGLDPRAPHRIYPVINDAASQRAINSIGS
jgi:hypothetical protein